MASCAGIIPYSKYNNTTFILLGLNCNNIWESCGGGRNPNESVKECAAREFYEETCGCILKK